MFTCLFVDCSGDSANAVPSTKKLRTRVTRIWGDRRGQPNRSAMVKPHPERTSFRIKVSLVPGKYDFLRVYKVPKESLIDRFGCSLYLHVHDFPAHSMQITALLVFYWQETQRAINLSLPDGLFAVYTTKSRMLWLFLKKPQLQTREETVSRGGKTAWLSKPKLALRCEKKVSETIWFAQYLVDI